MNYKTILMASAAVLFSTQAMAQDLTGAFSVPGKGQISADTTAVMNRAKAELKGTANRAAADSRAIAEFIEYGITDQFSINAGITNEFMHDHDYNNDHNFAYTLGAKYNTRFDDVLFQVAGHYNTWNPKDFYGHTWTEEKTDEYGSSRWRKSLGLDLKAGLDLGNGITPYIVYSIESDIDVAHRELEQSVKVGVHKYAGKWALDGAIRYAWEKNAKREYGKNETSTWFDAEADYYLRDNVALGIYGSYLIDTHDMQGEEGTYHVKDGHEIGIRLKVLF